MSSQQSYIKLTTNGTSFSRISAPYNYNDLKNIISTRFKDNIKDNIDIHFINLQNNTKITNKEEYEQSLANKGTVKLQVLFQEKQTQTKAVDITEAYNTNNNNLSQTNKKNEHVNTQTKAKVVDIIEAYNTNNNLSEHNKNNEHVNNNNNISLQNIVTDTVNTKLQSIQHELINELLTKISNLHQQQQQQQQHKQQQQQVKHIGITCSNCKQPNIVGIRYKCIKCNNYNLCETCENLCIHDIHHILLKIRLPINDNELPK